MNKFTTVGTILILGGALLIFGIQLSEPDMTWIRAILSYPELHLLATLIIILGFSILYDGIKE